MIREEYLTKEYRNFISNRFGGTPFGYARHFNMWFDATEIKYIETKIMTHKLYRIISGKAYNKQPDDHYLCAFFDMFLSDKACPDGVKRFLEFYTTHRKGMDQMRDSGEWEYWTTFKPDSNTNLRDSFFIQRWMETCR